MYVDIVYIQFMAKPKFYLEPRPSANREQAINMFYSFAGQRLQYYTGVRIDAKYFRTECNDSNTIQPIKTTAPNSTAYNQRLKNISTDAIKIVNDTKGENLNVKNVRAQLDLIYKPKPIEPKATKPFEHNFITFYEQILTETINGKRLITDGKNRGKKYTLNSIKNYTTALVAVKRYLDYEGIKSLPLQAVDKEFYENFSRYCYDVERKEVSTFAGYVKRIKTVMLESSTTDFKAKDFFIPSYDADTIALTLEQIDLIHALDLSNYENFISPLVVSRDNIGKAILNKKGERVLKKDKIGFEILDNVRDLFLIGCYSGLRFSDFNSLKIESVENGFIRVKQIKTGGKVTIPIMKRLQKVLDKYDGSLPKSVSNQYFNRLIKEVVKLAGIVGNVPLKSNTGNIETITDTPIYKLVSSHTARRSYATNMFKAGVPPMLIMSATSHKSENIFLRYIRATNEDKAKLLAETLTKLGL